MDPELVLEYLKNNNQATETKKNLEPIYQQEEQEQIKQQQEITTTTNIQGMLQFSNQFLITLLICLIILSFLLLSLLFYYYFLQSHNNNNNKNKRQNRHPPLNSQNLNEIEREINQLRQLNYQIIFWFNSSSIISLLNLLTEIIIQYIMKFHSKETQLLPMISINQLEQLISNLLQITSTLYQNLNDIQPLDIEEKIFLFFYINKLEINKKKLERCEQIINSFISTKTRLLFDLKKALNDQNVSDFLFFTHNFSHLFFHQSSRSQFSVRSY